MSKFCIQFHAILGELADFAETWMDKYPIHATTIEYWPSRTVHLMREDLRATLLRPEVRTILFTQSVADLSDASGSQLQLLEKNPGGLLLDIGRLGLRGLEESCLNTMDANAMWKKIANELKRGTKAGVVGVSDKTGAEGYYRNHRFTTGAKALSEAGTALRPFAQSPFVFHPKKLA